MDEWGDGEVHNMIADDTKHTDQHSLNQAK